MTRLFAEKVVKAILEKTRTGGMDQAVDFVLELAAKGLIRDPEKDPSPTAPSGSIPVYKKQNKRQRHKKPGRKKGHAPAFRKTPDKIDQREEHKLETCPHCGTPVNEPFEQRKHYIIDLPPAQPVVTEHIIYRYWCPCCHKSVEPLVTAALPGSNIGLQTLILASWLNKARGISLGSLVVILYQLFNFKLSPGALAKAMQRLAQLLKPEYDAIGEKVKNSSVLHLDETGWRISGITHWLWCFTNQLYCYFVIDQSRGSAVIKRVLGEIFRGTLISDFWSAYNKFQAWAKQKCLFHLFTELEKVDNRNFSAEWKDFRRRLHSLLKQAVKLWKDKAELGEARFLRRREKLERQLDQLIEMEYSEADCVRLLKRLKKHRQALFTFLYNEEVSPYNNHAEQQMRRPVIARKICQQNRSDKGAEAQAILMTIFRTAELQGENPISYAQKLAKNQLWQNKTTTKQHQKAA
jgi:transposase